MEKSSAVDLILAWLDPRVRFESRPRRHGGLHPKTLAELADITKAKQKQNVISVKNSANTKNLAEIVGRDENGQNQEVSPSLPSLPRVLGGDAHQAPDNPVEVEL